MSAIFIGEKGEGRESSTDQKGVRTYKRVFRVRTTSPWDDSDSVRSCNGIPRRYSPWVTEHGENDFGAVAVSVNTRQEARNPYLWEVEVGYTSDLGDEGKNQNDDNPLKRKTHIEFGFAVRQKILDYEATAVTVGDGSRDQKVLRFKGVVPSNEAEAFDPPPMIDEFIPVIKITRNENAIDPDQIIRYTGAVNTDNFFGFAPRQCRMKISTSTELVENDIPYRTVSYEIEVHPESWDLALLDVGTKYWTGGGVGQGLLKTAMDKEGHPSKVLLDGNGGKLADGQNANWLKFRRYRELPYAVLDLPQSL